MNIGSKHERGIRTRGCMRAARWHAHHSLYYHALRQTRHNSHGTRAVCAVRRAAQHLAAQHNATGGVSAVAWRDINNGARYRQASTRWNSDMACCSGAHGVALVARAPYTGHNADSPQHGA